MVRSCRIASIGALVALTLACGQSQPEARPEGAVVTSLADLWPTEVALPLDRPVAVFSGGAGTGVELTSVTEARRLSTGGVVVVDRRGAFVVWYAANGEVERVQGGRGGGPQEFESPATLTLLPGDTAVVYDVRNRRLTTLPPNGGEVRSEQLREPLFDRTPLDVWRLPDGRWLSVEGGIRDSRLLKRGNDADLVGPESIVRVVDSRTGQVDTLHSGTVSSESIRIGSMFLTAAFGRATYVDAAGSALAVAMPTGLEVRVFVDGTLTHTSSVPGAEKPLLREEVDRLRDSVRAASVEAGAPFMAEPMFYPDLQPDFIPPFGKVLVGDDGRVLLREYSPIGRTADTWWLLSPNGFFIGRLRLPPSTDLLEIGSDYLLALRLDSLDVPSVELHDIDWAELEARK